NYHDDKWHYLTITKRGSQYEIVLDGIEASYAFYSHQTPIPEQYNGIIIGADINFSHKFTGMVDEFRLWTCANITESIEDDLACPSCSNVGNCSSDKQCIAHGICSCKYGLSGDQCQEISCDHLNNCNGHGTCVIGSRSTKCLCDDGYIGEGEDSCKIMGCFGVPSDNSSVCSG